MNCTSLEQSLITYLDGKASPAERRGVDAHLAECAACRERAEQFRMLFGVLDEWQAPPPSPGFDAAVRARVAQVPARSSFWAWLLPSPRAAFALTAVVLLSLWLSSVRPSLPSQAVVAQVQTSGEADFKMIEDLPVLEDYDVLSNFDALSDLPASPAPQSQAPPRL
jgi:anti-sigma factor RsiW